MNWCLQSVYVCSAFLEKLGNARTFFLPVHRWKFRQAGSLLLNRCSHLDLRPPVLRGKVLDNIHISCLSGLCFCEFLIELSPSVEWRGFPKVLLRKELTAAAWKKKEAFGSSLVPIGQIIAHTQMVARMKTWAAVRRSSCFPRSILIRGQQVSAPVDIHKNNLLDILIDQEFSNLRCQRIARGWRG